MFGKIPKYGARQLMLVCLWFILALACVRTLAAQDNRTISVVPDQEQRSRIQAVDGYAYLSENMTLAETRATAFANAKRQALEAARTYIESRTKVENFQLQYDVVMSDAEGSVTVVEQKDHGVEDNNRYHVWIKAEVVYDLKPKKPEVFQAAIMDKDAPLTVKVWTEKKEYARGEAVIIFIEGNRDFYGRIVSISPSGDLIQLLPNDYRQSGFFEGGKTYRIPDKEDQFDLMITPPYGEEKIMVYASEVPLGEVNLKSVGKGLGAFMGREKDLGQQTRSISVVGGLNRQEKSAEFYEATWVFSTKDSGG
jgi:hypothetical protein